MCGRYVQNRALEALVEEFEIDEVLLEELIEPSFNVAPTQTAPVIYMQQDRRALRPMRWGLVPGWSRDDKSGARMINARSETVAEKPAFRNLLPRRRCLVPARGFYEWKRESEKAKTPYYFHAPDDGTLTFAGLWDTWRAGDGEDLHTFTILTTGANTVVQPVHHRMPVILGGDVRRNWLAPDATTEDLTALCVPAAEDVLTAYAVSSRVNSPARNDASLLDPAATQGSLL